MITLRNPTVLEIDLITTMGANVKECDNAIGQFGTGLKYAIACLLRNNIEVELYLGLNRYYFYTESKEIRGKDFSLCFMGGKYDSIPLGFTTELGANWTDWQAYRELFTNCVLDESGEVIHGKDIAPEEGWTTIHIKDDIDHENVFLVEMGKKLIFSNDSIEIFEGHSDYLYYQGIRAKDLNRPSMFTYNIKHGCTLTEDRCIAYDFQVNRMLSNAIVEMGNSEELLAARVLNSKDNYFESKIDFTEADKTPTEAFKTVYQNSPNSRNHTISAFMQRHTTVNERTREDEINDFVSELKSLCDYYSLQYQESDSSIVVNLESDQKIIGEPE